MTAMPQRTVLTDRFGRTIRYLRISVTDRCDFRCTYCMAEEMTFLPRKEILSHEEILLLAKTFISLGTEKIRITGGEPLIRANIISLMTELGKLKGLNELCITTNGSHLAEHAEGLKNAGVNALNISLDSLDHNRFRQLTRVGNLEVVLKGIDEAKKQKFDRIKLNSVILRNFNLDETLDLIEYALSRELDISFIEEMPLGEIQSHAREAEFIASHELREKIGKHFKLNAADHDTLGPSKYWQIENHPSRIGFISPHSHNFCESCNRVRLTAVGRLLLCLGNEHSVDLKQVLRSHRPSDINARLKEAIANAMNIKPERHEFDLAQSPQILRFMNATGG